MALYQDGILISGANTLPKMTLAEYNALPADQRPTYWERLDADYDDVLAEKSDIGNVESGTTASRAYSVGELLYYNDTLHRAKVPIASGATFTVGTNIDVTTIEKALVKKVSVNVTATAGGNTKSKILDNISSLIPSGAEFVGFDAPTGVDSDVILYKASNAIYSRNYNSSNITINSIFNLFYI